MISRLVSRTSAVVLSFCGFTLLFAADAVLPQLVPGFPRQAAWLGQLLGAAWVAVAALDWISQFALLGGIYGRPVVVANAVLYFVTAMSALRAASRVPDALAVWVIGGVAAVGALVYGWLMFRGPVESDLRAWRGEGGGAR